MVTRHDRANAIRALSMDAVQKANSGHPGMPMGMANIAEVLWYDFLRHNPRDPHWENRDRFILSNGHGSMLQYALLHLTGYDLDLNQLKNFRQLHSKTPGHPEYGLTPGVEVTTGPLGQGLSNAVGMAIAEQRLAAEFNKPDYPIVDHNTYVFLGDGCLMEGISHEVCSLAGHLGLGKLIAFWDDNKISIDGDVRGWFTDDTPARFKSYGWHVVSQVDGHDPEAIRGALLKALSIKDKPSLICCQTMIAFGAPNAVGTAAAHGSPLGDAEIAAARRQLGWNYPPFEVPAAIYGAWDAREKGAALQEKWNTLFAAYKKTYPDLAKEFIRRTSKKLPEDWLQTANTYIKQCDEAHKDIATRAASKDCLNAWGPHLPELFGGSADLSGSNCTEWRGSHVFHPENHTGNYLHYGVREFGMAGIMNGIARHGGFIPYGGTFLTFIDYMRNAIRLSAMMKQQVIYVLTHDSIGLGEDGPTHQPVEHLNMLRMTPNVFVWRPADGIETAVAWKFAIERTTGPTCLALSRQTLPHIERSEETRNHIERGGYILSDCTGTPEVIMMATGSELALAIKAAEQLRERGKKIRVVSMPCVEQFAAQEIQYQERVLPKTITKRIAIEAGATAFWYRYVGLDGCVIGIDQFGESAPYQAVYEFLGITVDKIIQECK